MRMVAIIEAPTRSMNQAYNAGMIGSDKEDPQQRPIDIGVSRVIPGRSTDGRSGGQDRQLANRNTEFSGTLKRLRSKSGKSRYRLAQFSGLDEAYLLRLESGER